MVEFSHPVICHLFMLITAYRILMMLFKMVEFQKFPEFFSKEHCQEM